MSTQKHYTEVLKCPGFGNLPSIIQDVVKEAIIDCFHDLVDCDVDVVDDTYYYQLLRDHLYDVTGDVKDRFYNNWEFSDFLRDEMGTLRTLDDQIQEAIKEILANNVAPIHLMYNRLTLQEIRVVLTMQDLLVISIKGTTLS